MTVAGVQAKTLVFQPASPRTCESVTFRAGGFTSANLRWDFGDGVTLTSGPTAVHAYAAPGRFSVKVADPTGLDPGSATTRVSVIETRSILVNPSKPRTGLPVQFQALRFIASRIRWDFGDGQESLSGPPTVSHVFKNPGTFRVRAIDNDGNSTCQATVQVPVIASQGPLAPFAISQVALHFAGGTAHVSVPHLSPDLTAYADLKFEGSGQLQVIWQVDGQPFRTATEMLSFARSVTIDSGKVPGLPTTAAGLHAVSLTIVQPQVGFVIPPIHYYVAASERPQPAGENLLAPVIQTVAPDSLERNREYTLHLQGQRLTTSTSVSLGAGIAINQFTWLDTQHASLKVFVSPTAQPGDRFAKASNDQGANTGPGKVSVTPAEPSPPEK